MNPDDLARILDELGKRLGPAGEHVFELAIRQVVIDAVITLAWAVPLLIATAITTYLVGRWTIGAYRKEKAEEDPRAYHSVDVFPYALSWLLAGLIIVCIVIVAGTALVYNLSRILNPEYAAIRDILNAVHP